MSAETKAKIGSSRSKYTKEKSSSWKGGRRITSSGYVELFLPDHPRARGNGYVFEHIVVMEQTLGRCLLVGEVVHHKDRKKQNNSPDNLMLVTPREHGKLHPRVTIRVEFRCAVCDSAFYDKPSHVGMRLTCSMKCAGELFREYYTGKPRDYRPSEEDKKEAIKRAQQHRTYRQAN